ncbi:MAG: hypothetical protein U0270_31555 [Labilithrix sp.]
MTTKTNTNPWLMDSRVRERNLKSGALTEKDLEKHLAALPDLEGQYDAVSTPQPALEQPRVAAPVVDEESDSDLGDDEDDDESSDDVGGDESSDDVGGGDAGGGDAGDEPGEDPKLGGGDA